MSSGAVAYEVSVGCSGAQVLPVVPQPRSSLDMATLTIWARIKPRRQGRVKSTASDTRQVRGQTGRSVGRAGAVRGGRWPGTGRPGAGAWHLCTTAGLGLEAQSGGCRGSQGLVLSETLSCALFAPLSSISKQTVCLCSWCELHKGADERKISVSMLGILGRSLG